MHNPGAAGFWLSPQQKRIWTLQQEGSAYRSVCLALIEDALPVEKLERALRRLVARHEILRTAYVRQPGMKFPFQVVLESAEPSLDMVDLSGLPDSKQKEQFEELFRNEQVRSVGPESEPVLVAKLATCGSNHCALILSLPAMTADARSLQVLVREIGQFASGTAADT